MAERLWRPASPNTSARRRLAPSITAGCWTKPGADATNPEHGEHAGDAVEGSEIGAQHREGVQRAPARGLGAFLDRNVRAEHAGMHEVAVVIARQLPRRAGPISVHHDRVERIVRRVRPRQDQTQRLQSIVDRAHSHLSKKCRDVGAVPAVITFEHAVHERTVGRVQARVHVAQLRDRGAGHVGREDHVVGARLDEQRPRCDQRRDVEVLDRAQLAGHHLRAAHVPRHGVRGAPRRQVARDDGDADAVVERGEEQGAGSAERQARDRDPGRVDERAARPVRRARGGDPTGSVRAARRRPSWRTRDPSRSGTCRRASSRNVRRSRACRARAPRSRATRVGARSRRPDLRARPRTPSTCPGRARAPRAPRDRAARPAVREARAGRPAPTSSLRRRTRRARAYTCRSRPLPSSPGRAGPAPDARRGARRAERACAPATHPDRSAAARRRAPTSLELQPPVRPVGEVARAAHPLSFSFAAPSVQPRPPARWRRYAGDSHAEGKCPRLVENTRPAPSAKHHASGYPNDGVRAPPAARSSSPSRTRNSTWASGRRSRNWYTSSCHRHSAPRCAHAGCARVEHVGDERLRPRMTVEARADDLAVLGPAVARVGRGMDGAHGEPARAHLLDDGTLLVGAPRRLADREQRERAGGGDVVDGNVAYVVDPPGAQARASRRSGRPRPRPGRARRARPRARRDTARPGSRTAAVQP